MQLSIVVGYRNRDFERVKRFLDSIQNQTFKDFELIFVDYGSELSIANDVKILVANYSFAKYIYNCTMGMPWNRAHALNTGIRTALGEYILLTDVDLIFSNNFVSYIVTKVEENVQFYKEFYLLSQNFSKWKDLKDNKLDISSLKKSGTSAKGAIQIIKKEFLLDLNGFDEFYCFWGVEDRDLSTRIEKLGIETKWLPPEIAPVFHQWHSIATAETGNFMPEKWWEQMCIYNEKNENKIKRNLKNWGKIFIEDERKAFIAFKTNKNIVKHEVINDFHLINKTKEINLVFQKFYKLPKEQCLEIEIKKEAVSKVKQTYFNRLIIKIVTIILNGIKHPFTLIERDLKNNFYKDYNTLFRPEKDMFYIIWQLIKIEEMFSDYYIYEDKKKIRFILAR